MKDLRRKRRVKDYAKIIAKEEGIPVAIVNTLLIFCWKNVLKMLKRKEDIALEGFGRIWIEKKPKRKTVDEPIEVEIQPAPWEL